MFDKSEGEETGGRSPLGKQGGLEAARPLAVTQLLPKILRQFDPYSLAI